MEGSGFSAFHLLKRLVDERPTKFQFCYLPIRSSALKLFTIGKLRFFSTTKPAIKRPRRAPISQERLLACFRLLRFGPSTDSRVLALCIFPQLAIRSKTNSSLLWNVSAPGQ